MDLALVAIVAVILFVAQAQVDVLFASPSPNRTVKLILLVIAVLALLFQKYHG